MATTPDADDSKAVGRHTPACLRSLDRKLDLVIDASQRQAERLARVERDLGETRRDIVEVKGDITLLENKVVSAQTEILAILRRLDDKSDRESSAP